MDTQRSKSRKWLPILLLSLVLALLISAGGFFYFYAVQNIAPTLTLEVGDTFHTSDFLLRAVPFRVETGPDHANINWSKPGQYPITLHYLGRDYHCTLNLVDTTAPIITTKDVTCFSYQTVTMGDFIVECSDNTQITLEYVTPPDMTLEGTQQIQLKLTDQGGNVTLATANLTLTIDKQAPVIQGFQDYTIYVGKPVDVHANITVTDDWDETPQLTIDDGGLDLEKGGVYTVTYTATDASGNTSTETATITVIHDSQGPQIFGVNKLSIYQGSTISYRKGIIVTDDYDQFPKLSIDSSQVNMEVPGTYEVIYTATDIAGNSTTVKTTVTIKEKPDTYVDEAIILAEADKIIAQIITDGMTAREQVEAIFNYVTASYRYISYSDKTDRLQAAYAIMGNKYGDCFNFYAITSLLMERLSIPQIAVERSPNSVRPTRHYWSLVSIDGGKTYYHVDTCPHYPYVMRSCLLTDAQLELFNAQTPGYYTMDPGKYPETPKEPLA